MDLSINLGIKLHAMAAINMLHQATKVINTLIEHIKPIIVTKIQVVVVKIVTMKGMNFMEHLSVQNSSKIHRRDVKSHFHCGEEMDRRKDVAIVRSVRINGSPSAHQAL